MGEAEKRAAPMTSPSDHPLTTALGDLLSALRDVGAPHMIIGGLAVIARGVVRHTDDADATIWAAELDLHQLLNRLEQRGIVGRIPDVEEFAMKSQVLLLIHERTGVPVDVSLAWLPFEREALDRAEFVRVSGVDIPMATAQDLIIYKVIAWRERDRTDAEGLLRLHRSRVDLQYVRGRVAEFLEAIEEPERLIEFDAMVARVDSQPLRG